MMGRIKIFSIHNLFIDASKNQVVRNFDFLTFYDIIGRV